MDSYGLTCKGGPSTATRRTKLKEQAQPRRGPSSRSMQMVMRRRSSVEGKHKYSLVTVSIAAIYQGCSSL
ncbi:hypothetical protein NDA11_005352 [Ustilago hordei]|nr:hypothetical protein NDA11_005352 [Ustilago hordei]